MKKYQRIDKQAYNDIKKMLEAGVSGSTVARLVGISQPTISNINTTDNYEAYKEKTSLVSKTIKKVIVPSVPMPGNLAPEPVVAQLRELTSKVNTLTAENTKLTNKVEEMLEAYRWVLEHAQMDTRKKKFW